MDKKLTLKKVAIIVLVVGAYLATFILGAASGAIHPACYAYIGALLPLVPMMIVVLLLTIPAAILAMRLAERVMKKSATKLQ